MIIRRFMLRPREPEWRLRFICLFRECAWSLLTSNSICSLIDPCWNTTKRFLRTRCRIIKSACCCDRKFVEAWSPSASHEEEVTCVLSRRGERSQLVDDEGSVGVSQSQGRIRRHQILKDCSCSQRTSPSLRESSPRRTEVPTTLCSQWFSVTHSS